MDERAGRADDFKLNFYNDLCDLSKNNHQTIAVLEKKRIELHLRAQK